MPRNLSLVWNHCHEISFTIYIPSYCISVKICWSSYFWIAAKPYSILNQTFLHVIIFNTRCLPSSEREIEWGWKTFILHRFQKDVVWINWHFPKTVWPKVCLNSWIVCSLSEHSYLKSTQYIGYLSPFKQLQNNILNFEFLFRCIYDQPVPLHTTILNILPPSSYRVSFI